MAERANVAGTVDRADAGPSSKGKGRSRGHAGRRRRAARLVRRPGGSGHPLRLTGDSLHMKPLVAERRQQFLGIARRPLAGRHAGTIARWPLLKHDTTEFSGQRRKRRDSIGTNWTDSGANSASSQD
jgi:hypothetical protein